MSDPHFSHEAWLSKLRDHLETERYAHVTAYQCIAAARHFLAYLEKQRVEIGAAQAEDIERYLQHARQRYCRLNGHSPNYEGWRCSHTSGIHMLLRLAQGRWPPVLRAITPAEMQQQELCEEYSRWMASVYGPSHETLSQRYAEAHRFLSWLSERARRKELSLLTVVDVDAYMKDRAAPLRRPSLKKVATNIRSFLWWLYVTDRTTQDFSMTVITPSLYRFENIPSALRAEDVKKVLTLTEHDCTPKGIRDYAILMLISTYGVRAGEIRTLRLDDIDWRKEVIRIRHSKTGTTSYLPMRVEVGEAILQYLQKSRPETLLREIFIRSRAPYRPLKRLYMLVRRRLETAGVSTTGKRGPHAFRHARAVSMLRAAVPVKKIGDLLGHRAADSTLVYLKLATEDLRAVAMEIPTEVKP